MKALELKSWKPAELFFISLVSLYFELVVIRWLSSEIRIFAYFKNIPLMACLFGLGLGMAVARSKTRISAWFPAGLLAVVALVCSAGPLNLVHVAFVNPLEHYLIGSFTSGAGDDIASRLKLFVPGLALLVGVFYLLVFTFACIGQRIGQLLNEFRPLVGYSLNVIASLVGILLYTLVSFLSLPPLLWLVIGFACAAACYHKPLQLAAMGAAVALTAWLSPPGVHWSPYYRISLEPAQIAAEGDHPPFDYGYHINVNYDAIQGAYNNNPDALSALSSHQRKGIADYYDTPYLALGRKPGRVLVLAAGTGNDVAAALRHGATAVDAVEIDPTIARLGEQIHPERPYSDPRVRVIVDDARAFLRRTDKRYDLIVFAYLDSHTAFSSMSSLRLDNYVYTRECFQDAYRLLAPDGAMAVTFYYMTWWQLARVSNSLEQGCGSVPLGVYSPMGNGPTLLVGPGVSSNLLRASGLAEFSRDAFLKQQGVTPRDWADVGATTDDWPFLFLRSAASSWTYAIGLVFTLYVGWWLVGKCFGSFTSEPIGRVMFFLGAAFMLIETKSVTQIGLLAGTTWVVNAAVIAAVLVLILAANALHMKFRFRNLQGLYGLLFATLAFNLMFPLSALNHLDAMTRTVAGSLVLCAPLLFAALIFAATFSGVSDPGRALGMNLLGTLVGGALEYLSMMVGINALNVVAAVLYALAFFFWRRQEAPGAEAMAVAVTRS